MFLARKQETGEVCALKKMMKRALFKMDEVSIVDLEFYNVIDYGLGPACSCRARYPNGDKDALAGPSPLRIPRPSICIPRHGICSRR